jgi:hypothetical protein
MKPWWLHGGDGKEKTMKHAKMIELTFRRTEGDEDVEMELRLEGDGWKEEFSLEQLKGGGERFQMVMEAVRATLVTSNSQYDPVE